MVKVIIKQYGTEVDRLHLSNRVMFDAEAKVLARNYMLDNGYNPWNYDYVVIRK